MDDLRVPVPAPTAETGPVLADVVRRRHEQIAKWGHNEDTPDGTGPSAEWLGRGLPYDIVNATRIERELRYDYDAHVRRGGQLTWMHFLREEFAEAMCEDDPAKLYDELMDVAAVIVSWSEKLRQRGAVT